MTNKIQIKIFLFSAFIFNQAYSVDLQPPTTLKTAPSGKPINAPGQNKEFLCIPGVPEDITIQQTNNFWLDGLNLIISEYSTVAVEGDVYNGPSFFYTTLTETERHFHGNGIPNHKTGIYPVQEGTKAYAYYSTAPAQGYSSAAEIPIEPYNLDVIVPRNPIYSETPYCINQLVVGIATQTGSRWDASIAYSDRWVDPIAALPLDECWGHPYNKQYHYHGYSWKCFPNLGSTRQHSPLLGYALDGFGIYGPRGDGGKLLTNNDLDACHGHMGIIDWDGNLQYMYHYHVNAEFPYGPGCFRGLPALITSFQALVHVHGEPIPPHT